MLNQSDKFERFAEVINNNAQKQCSKIEEQMVQIQDQEIQKLKARIASEYESKLSYELGKMKAQSNHDFSEKSSITKKYLIGYRQELADKVFAKVTLELENFAKSDKYEEFLSNSLKRLSEGLSDEFTAYVKKGELKTVSNLAKEFKLVIAVKESDEITTGGIIAKNMSETVVINDTLDQRMIQQQQWFEKNSNLSISE